MTVHCLWSEGSLVHWLGPELQDSPHTTVPRSQRSPPPSFPENGIHAQPVSSCHFTQNLACVCISLAEPVTWLSPVARESGNLSVPLPPWVGKNHIVGNSPNEGLYRRFCVATKHNKCPHCARAHLSNPAHSRHPGVVSGKRGTGIPVTQVWQHI